MATKGYYSHYHNPYTNLAAAILNANKMDKRFVDSDWAELLRDMCRLDNEMYDNGRNTPMPRNITKVYHE